MIAGPCPARELPWPSAQARPMGSVAPRRSAGRSRSGGSMHPTLFRGLRAATEAASSPGAVWRATTGCMRSNMTAIGPWWWSMPAMRKPSRGTTTTGPTVTGDRRGRGWTALPIGGARWGGDQGADLSAANRSWRYCRTAASDSSPIARSKAARAESIASFRASRPARAAQ